MGWHWRCMYSQAPSYGQLVADLVCLWQGRVTSYIGRDLQRYTAFRVQPTLDGPIRQFLFTDKGVIVLGTRTIHMAMRRGPTLWSIRYECRPPPERTTLEPLTRH